MMGGLSLSNWVIPPTSEETVIYIFSHISQKSTMGRVLWLWTTLSAFTVVLYHRDAPVTAQGGPLDAYVFGRAVSCPWLQKSWRGWLRWEKQKWNKAIKQSRVDTDSCRRTEDEKTWLSQFPMEANDSLESWNQEPRAMDRRAALRHNCLREGHSCSRHCFRIKEAELTSFLAKLSLPRGPVTDGHGVPTSSCPLSFVFLC